MKITDLSKIVSCLKLQGFAMQNDKQAYELFKAITSGYGKDMSCIEYKGQRLQELPNWLQNMAGALKKPKITVNGRSAVEGQGIFGIKVQDGNKQLFDSVLGVDLTKGEPILQFRGNMGDGSKRIVSFSTIFDTNKAGREALRHGIDFDEELLKKAHIPKGMKEILIKGEGAIPVNIINENAQQIRTLFANNGRLVYSIQDSMDELVKIGSKTGRVTQKSATEAVNSLLERMGYNPEDVKLAFISKEGNKGLGGLFDIQTGKLSLNINELTNHQDLAVILGHEITHMEDALILYKYLGAEKYGKLVGDYNHEWFEKMSKFVNHRAMAYQRNGKTISVDLGDGKIITDPKKIKEFEKLMPKEKFDVDAMIKEIKFRNEMEKLNVTGEYSQIASQSYYELSPMEKHARETERHIIGTLKRNGLYRNTHLSRHLGQGPLRDNSEDYTTLFNQLDKAIGKENWKEFNNLYKKSLAVVEPEIAALQANGEELMLKLQGKMPTSERVKIENEIEKIDKEINDILASKYGSNMSNLQIRVMDNMRESLGLQRIPSHSELFDIAIEKISPEIAQIRKNISSKTLPVNEVDKLIKQEEKLIAAKEFFWEKVNAMSRELKKEYQAKY